MLNIMSSIINRPSGDPNDRNAVFDGTFVLQINPLNLRFSILYAPLKSCLVLFIICKQEKENVFVWCLSTLLGKKIVIFFFFLFLLFFPTPISVMVNSERNEFALDEAIHFNSASDCR